ncbi:MAG: hypothetical protein ABJE47_01815 [bacterium]
MKIHRYIAGLRGMPRINMSLTRGAVASAARVVDPTRPDTWEFSGFSQNGEDGIVDVLRGQLLRENRYFVEIGSGDGLENNTSWLALVHRFSGIWVEGNRAKSRRGRAIFSELCDGTESISMFVTRAAVPALLGRAREADPDVFSLDVDGVDFHIAEALFDGGFRPKICVVEYNASFGPDMRVTVPYADSFRARRGRGNNLYFGCSVAGWTSFFERRGYRFITVDQHGVNAVFVDPAAFPGEFLEGITGCRYRESFVRTKGYGHGWSAQFALMADREFVWIE